MDYMEEKEYRRKEDKKNRYKQALDKQVNQQKIRRKREYDIEHGNFQEEIWIYLNTIYG